MKMLNFLKRKSATIWVAVNKNGKIALHGAEPQKDEARGIWVSERPYVNSLLYANMSNMIEKTDMSWQSQPEPFEIQFKYG